MIQCAQANTAGQAIQSQQNTMTSWESLAKLDLYAKSAI